MIGGGNQTFQTVIDLVYAWRPEKAYGHENKFQTDLKDFLEEQLNEQGSGSPIGGIMGGGARNYVVGRERGNARGDVVVDDTVGIEMKRDFSNSQKKKLRGQLEEYAENYPFVLAVACGVEDKDGWRELENKFTGQASGLGMNQTQFEFIIKRKENFGDPHEFGGGGGGIFGF